MKLNKGKLAKYLIKATGKLPLPVAQWAGHRLGYGFWLANGRMRHVTETNLDACFPTLTKHERRDLAFNTLLETGKTVMETAVLWTRSMEYGRRYLSNIVNESLLDEALESEQGVVLILPHLGNWELTNHYISNKASVVAMYQPAKLPELEEIMQRARNRSGTKMVPTNASGVKTIFKHLKQGGTTVILADQEPAKESGHMAEFFGVPALTGVLVPRLVNKTKSKALMIFTLRKENNKFEVHIQPVDEALYSDDMNVAIAGLNRSVESCVEMAQSQYQWSYKRFKTQLMASNSNTPIYQR